MFPIGLWFAIEFGTIMFPIGLRFTIGFGAITFPVWCGQKGIWFAMKYPGFGTKALVIARFFLICTLDCIFCNVSPERDSPSFIPISCRYFLNLAICLIASLYIWMSTVV